MQGNLATDHLPGVIRTLHRERESGILEISRGSVSKRIFFGEGEMVFAQSSMSSDRLGEFLVRQGRMTRSQLADASNKKRATGQMLGVTLVSLGLLGAEELQETVEAQIRAIICSLFAWENGNRQFDHFPKSFTPTLELDLPTIPIILEGTRQVRDAETIRRALGDLNRVVSYSRDPWVHAHAANLTPVEGFVLSRVDGQCSLSDIVAITPLDDDETLRCLYGLVSSGFLEFGAKTRAIREKEVRRMPIERFHRSASTARPAATPSPKPERVTFTEEEWRLRSEIGEKHAAVSRGSFYQWLGVQRDATEADIRKAYAAAIKKFHPDRCAAPALSDLRNELGEIVRKLMEAYGILSDPTARRRYDNSLQTEAPRGENVEPASAPTSVPVQREDTPAEKLAQNYYREATRSFQRADFHRTMTLMEEAVALDPKAAYHRLLGKALGKNPKWRKSAEEHFQKALDLEPFDFESYLGLADLYETAGLASRAKAMLSRALELDPGNEMILSRLGGMRKH